jgi:hypothetical protein
MHRRRLCQRLGSLPDRLHALSGNLSLAAFAAAILAPQATGRRLDADGGGGAAAGAALLAWRGFGRGKPLKLAPLLRLLRR